MSKSTVPDILVKELNIIGSKLPIGMTWLEFCTKYPARAACMLEVSVKTEIRTHSELKALEARIDQLMLEYCPDEMTSEQKTNWAEHQVPVKNDART